MSGISKLISIECFREINQMKVGCKKKCDSHTDFVYSLVRAFRALTLSCPFLYRALPALRFDKIDATLLYTCHETTTRFSWRLFTHPSGSDFPFSSMAENQMGVTCVTVTQGLGRLAAAHIFSARRDSDVFNIAQWTRDGARTIARPPIFEIDRLARR